MRTFFNLDRKSLPHSHPHRACEDTHRLSGSGLSAYDFADITLIHFDSKYYALISGNDVNRDILWVINNQSDRA